MTATRGLIFDYGGTLDTWGNHWGMVLWHAYEKSGVPVSEEEFRQAYVYGERTLATRHIIDKDFSFRDTLEAKIRLQMEWLSDNARLNNWTDYHALVLNMSYAVAQEATTESAQTLQLLTESYPMVLVSNFYGNISNVLREFGLERFFRNIIESAVVGIRKPYPRIFALGVEKLGMRAQEVMVVGDSHDKDIVPAHSIGCRTAWIKGEGWTNKEPENIVADCIIHRLSDLTNTLLVDEKN